MPPNLDASKYYLLHAVQIISDIVVDEKSLCLPITKGH